MTPIPTVLILLAVVSLFYVLIPFFTSTSKRRIENLVRKLNLEGAANNLTFCSQEILQNKVIGIDGIHKKIMVLEKKSDGYYSSIISLDEVHDCQLVTKSGSINSSNLKKFSVTNQPSTLELQFDFNNHTQPASIIFSNGSINSKKEFAFLKAKAEYWCTMFTKMLSPQMDVQAYLESA
ncbi:MAG TPA: hypothetical protein VFI29_22615 [Hanamia sp.]|nr:hypothetical protein [Hanamia sp.]